MHGPCILSCITLIGTVSISEDGEGRITGIYLPNSNLPCMEDGETDVLREGYAATAEAIEVPQQPAQAGSELPATGGPGTARYMAGGIALLLAAGLTYLLPRLREKRHL